VTRHHENAGQAFKRFLERGPIGQFGNDRLRISAQDLTRLIRIAHDANRRVTELREFFDNGAARVAGRPNNGNHGFLPSLVVFQRKFYLSVG
jgi:hypothetical protein